MRSRDIAEFKVLKDEGEGEQKVKSDVEQLVGDLILALAAALMKVVYIMSVVVRSRCALVI